MHLAVKEQDITIVKVLLSASNVSLSIRDKFGQTPLSLALQMKCNKAAEAIVERDALAAVQVYMMIVYEQ